MITKEYQKINDPSRRRQLACGDKYALEQGWIPVQEPKVISAKPKQPEATIETLIETPSSDFEIPEINTAPKTIPVKRTASPKKPGRKPKTNN